MTRSPQAFGIRPPRYEEWLNFCFLRFDGATTGDDLWNLYGDDDLVFTDAEILDLYAATLENCEHDLGQMPDVMLGYGLSIMFEGHFANYVYQLCGNGVDRSKQIATLRSIEKLFRRVIEPRNLPLYVGESETSKCRLGWAVFDFWDNSVLNTFTDKARIGAIIDVMEGQLKLNSDACIQSGLHGLGHQRWSASQRIESIIDRFLADRADVNPRLRTYALDCRTGCIQ